MILFQDEPSGSEAGVHDGLLGAVQAEAREVDDPRPDGRGGVAEVEIGDLQGRRGYNGQRAYNQSKLANILFTSELGRRTGLPATAFHPGLVRTEQSALHYGDEAGIARVAQTVPMQRLAEPSDIGEACLWVASPQASYLSGTNLTLHGGGERPAFLAAASVNANASTPH